MCLGAIDGKHCVINCPPGSDSAFFNYKGTLSILLMAVIESSYMLTFVYIGDFGRQCDSSVFNNSPFGEALNNGRLNIPVDGHLKIIYSLKDNLLRPHPGRNLEEK